MDAEERIVSALINAIRKLPDDVETLILEAAESEEGRGGALALDAIVKNIGCAARTGLPLCQDTGMFWCLALIGRGSKVSIGTLEELITSACMRAAEEGYYRKSVVSDPIYSRENTRTNLPPVISYECVDGDGVALSFLLKGFGSENCSSVRMLKKSRARLYSLESVSAERWTGQPFFRRRLSSHQMAIIGLSPGSFPLSMSLASALGALEGIIRRLPSLSFLPRRISRDFR